MGILSDLLTLLTDDRFTANLIAAHGVIVVIVVASLILRRLLMHGSHRLGRWTGLQGLDAVGKEAARQGHALLFWLTVTAVLATVAGGVGYHLLGHDIRRHLGAWYEQLTAEDLLHAGLALAALAGLAVTSAVTVRVVRRLRPRFEQRVTELVGPAGNDEAVRHWFVLLERFTIAAVRLATLWGAGQVVGLGELADRVVGFILRVITILAVARLLTLACRTLSRAAAELGDRHLSKGGLQRYWERVKRLFPFGERCFEAAVYISAASLCVKELHFIDTIARFGPRIVECIGIFFCTRVLIELLQVLLHEAFGLYNEGSAADQKGRTLVPLLHSVCQYVLYFGSVVVMLGTLGINTQPILAGAGILGLAVGLGAQSLVTDVVSGFFILFESQYLVGDYVSIGGESGTVEAVGIRVTQLRDGQGKLHIIPNGQIKGVVSYSKDYVNAVVDMKVPAGNDLEQVFRCMKEAGHILRQTRPEVLADTVIHGVVELGTSEMTVRAVTKVQPGTHGIIQNEYRRLLKQVFDQKQSATRPALAA